MNLGQALNKSIHDLKTFSETPELDARVLLSYVSGQSYEAILSHPEIQLSDREVLIFSTLIERRKKLEPISYITGTKEFYGLIFAVTPDVLVPRPETEFLVEETLRLISLNKNPAPQVILDLGTGSGCIILSLAYMLNRFDSLPSPTFIGTDISLKALQVARTNAKKLDLDNMVHFFQSNLLQNPNIPKNIDVIIANLPYVPIESKPSIPESIDYEPQIAIFAEENGTKVINEFITQLANWKFKHLLMEVDPRNINSIASTLKRLFPQAKIKQKKDLANHPRYLLLSK